MLAATTDRKSAEDAIRESEERFRLVANTAPVLICMSDVDKLCTYFNEPWLEFTGESLESQLGNGWANSQGLPSPVPPDISFCLFRVLQESLHNSAKHSGAQHVEVELWGMPDEIHLVVSDSGSGFDSEGAKRSLGLGLISMEERLRVVKGRFSIESQAKRGTKIHARVPLGSRSGSNGAAGQIAPQSPG